MHFFKVLFVPFCPNPVCNYIIKDFIELEDTEGEELKGDILILFALTASKN